MIGQSSEPSSAFTNLARGNELLSLDALGAREGITSYVEDDGTWVAMGNKVDELERYAGPALAGPLSAAWRAMSAEHLRVVEQLRWARDSVAELRGDYSGACRQVADMHRAAFGRLTGPVHHDSVQDMRVLGDTLRSVRATLTAATPDDADPVEGMDLTTCRELLRALRAQVGEALDGKQPPGGDDDAVLVRPGETIEQFMERQGEPKTTAS